MIEKIINFSDYFRKIPLSFLVALLCVVAFILFVPVEVAKALAVDSFREQYRVYLGPTFLLTFALFIARFFMFFMGSYEKKKNLRTKQESLHKLTPEEKGFLVVYIQEQQNSIHVGMEDGVMGGLKAKGITYLAGSMGDVLNGFAFNLQPWAREYLENNPNLLDGYSGRPMTPQQKLHSKW